MRRVVDSDERKSKMVEFALCRTLRLGDCSENVNN